MRIITISFLVLISVGLSFAQSPQAFKYQTIVRDNTGTIISNQAIGFRISILDSIATGAVVYQETHLVNTNDYGLANLEIGNGAPISGLMSDVDWSNNDKFLQVEVDIAGGANYQLMGTSQLLSVPFALHSETTNDTTRWRKDNNGLYYVNGSVGIGTNLPDESALLDLNSSSKGFLPPRITNHERDAISSPAPGLFIFNSDEQALQFYDGSSWKYLSPGSCVPLTPSSISGINSTYCNQSDLSYTIQEVPWASNYNWTIPANATIVSGQGTTNIIVNMGTHSGNISVRAESGCGNSSYRNLAVSVNPPAQPGGILTSNYYPECYETGVEYSINEVDGASSYNWTVPSDASITSGQGTTMILVNMGIQSGFVGVRAESDCGNSDYRLRGVTISSPPLPGIITGITFPECNSQNIPYSIEAVNGATSYNWIVPTGASIESGQGSSNIIVNFSISSGDISVRAENTCGTSSYASLPITISIPSQPGIITGNSYPECNSTANEYSILPVNGATNYNWTVPSGASIESGQGTTNILVSFTSSSGNVSVRAENSCGNSSYEDFPVNINIPVQPENIAGPILIEPNSTGKLYSISPINGATSYNWIVPTGAIITSGQGTTNIVVDFGTNPGYVSVRSENSCGYSNYSDLEIAIFTCGSPFTDTRDGKTYNSIWIGTQCWFVENLDIGTRIDGVNLPVDNETIEKYCYNDDDANCIIYGGLYLWDETMQYITTNGTTGICPDGWHVPTDAEWCILENEVETGSISCFATGYRGVDAGGSLKQTGTTIWNYPNNGATNSSGFTALPGGARGYNGGFFNMGSSGRWQSSTESSSTNNWIRGLSSNNAQVDRISLGKTPSANSVRCLRD